MAFLPITKEEMVQREWDQADFVLVTGDAYVDHPSFGAAIISRVLEDEGFRVAVLPPRIGGATVILCGLAGLVWPFW